MMAEPSNIHVAVYQLLDRVLATPVPPPGANAAIHSIIDGLHAAGAPPILVDQAERISLQMHHLDAAVRRDCPAEALVAREELRSIAAAWMDRRIKG